MHVMILSWSSGGASLHKFGGMRSMIKSSMGYGMVFIYSTSLYIIYIAHHYNTTQDAEREMHEVQYLYVAFP